MTDKIKLFKLITGDQIIAMVDEATIDLDEYITLSFPVEVLTEYTETQRGLHERFNLKPWQSLTSSDSLTINSSVILYVTEMKEEFVTEYMGTVEHFYMGGKDSMEDEELPKLKASKQTSTVH